jgi:hypothetical protein
MTMIFAYLLSSIITITTFWYTFLGQKRRSRNHDRIYEEIFVFYFILEYRERERERDKETLDV